MKQDKKSVSDECLKIATSAKSADDVYALLKKAFEYSPNYYEAGDILSTVYLKMQEQHS